MAFTSDRSRWRIPHRPGGVGDVETAADGAVLRMAPGTTVVAARLAEDETVAAPMRATPAMIAYSTSATAFFNTAAPVREPPSPAANVPRPGVSAPPGALSTRKRYRRLNRRPQTPGLPPRQLG